MSAEAVDGLSLVTVHVYSPALVTVRVWVYCAVTGSSNTVSVPSVTVTESLVQVTLVAGPPVEIQVRVFPDNITPSGMVISPTREKTIFIHCRVPVGSFPHSSSSLYTTPVESLNRSGKIHNVRSSCSY